VPDVGQPTTSTSAGRLRPSGRGLGVLLSLLSHALADAALGAGDELDMGDPPDVLDDDCPQGFVINLFSYLSVPAFAAPDMAPNLWGIQPSIGHPQGDDEPPRT
jgi:hypothetical protein